MTALTPTGLAPTGLTARLQAGSGDVTAPVLSNPTGTNTGRYSAIGSVNTTESGGLLYYITTTSASATAAAVKAGSNAAVAASGVQNITITGLSAGVTYYNHFLHRDAAGNESAVASSSGWATEAIQRPAGVVTITDIIVGATSAIFEYEYSTTDATGYEYQLDSNGAVYSVTANPQSISGLTASTNYTVRCRATNDAGAGDWSPTAAFKTAPATVATFTTGKLTDLNGIVQAHKSLLYLAAYNKTTGQLVVRKTAGLTTDANGRCTISDSALTTGQEYRWDWETVDGERCMPLGTAQ